MERDHAAIARKGARSRIARRRMLEAAGIALRCPRCGGDLPVGRRYCFACAGYRKPKDFSLSRGNQEGLMETRIDSRGGTERVLARALGEETRRPTGFSPRVAAAERPPATAPAQPPAEELPGDEEIGERVRALIERRRAMLVRLGDIEKSYDVAEVTLQDLERSL